MMNRQMRRMARRAARAKPEREFNDLAPLMLLCNASPHEPGEKTVEHLKTLSAFERLKDGSANEDDFIRVAMVINMTKVRALQIDEALADMLERGQDAMTRCAQRFDRVGRYGFDGPGLTLVDECLIAAQAIIDASSPLQMLTARNVVADQLFGKGTAARLIAQQRAAARRAGP